MPQMQTQKAKGGSKKVGRSKDKCARYAVQMRRYKNKVRRAKKRYGACSPKTLEKVIAGIKFS